MTPRISSTFVSVSGEDNKQAFGKKRYHFIAPVVPNLNVIWLAKKGILWEHLRFTVVRYYCGLNCISHNRVIINRCFQLTECIRMLYSETPRGMEKINDKLIGIFGILILKLEMKTHFVD